MTETVEQNLLEFFRHFARNRPSGIIEDLAGVNMSVYGTTVGLIGQVEAVEVARKAIDMLLRGSEHATVYRFLERSRGKLRILEMGFEP